jgi:hypothetical protein
VWESDHTIAVVQGVSAQCRAYRVSQGRGLVSADRPAPRQPRTPGLTSGLPRVGGCFRAFRRFEISRRSAVALLCNDLSEILGYLAVVTSELYIEVPLVAVGRLSSPLFTLGGSLREPSSRCSNAIRHSGSRQADSEKMAALRKGREGSVNRFAKTVPRWAFWRPFDIGTKQLIWLDSRDGFKPACRFPAQARKDVEPPAVADVEKLAGPIRPTISVRLSLNSEQGRLCARVGAPSQRRLCGRSPAA